MKIQPLGRKITEFKPNEDAIKNRPEKFKANINRRINYEIIAFDNKIFSFKIIITIKISIVGQETTLLSYIGERKFNIEDDFDGSLSDRITNDKIAIYELLKNVLIDAESYVICNEKRLKYVPEIPKEITVWVQELTDFLSVHGFY